jgi:hypothetical protein
VLGRQFPQERLGVTGLGGAAEKTEKSCEPLGWRSVYSSAGPKGMTKAGESVSFLVSFDSLRADW